jgi:hypothetical protein
VGTGRQPDRARRPAERRAKPSRSELDLLQADARIVTERCAYCRFEVQLPLKAAQAAFERHECSRPTPKPTVPKRRPSGFGFRRS